MSNTLVLLSGGMDSVAAMHWAIAKFPPRAGVEALGIDYGQPQRDAELPAAQAIAGRCGVPFTTLVIAEAARGLAPLAAPTNGRDAGGVSRANLAARNAVLLSVAAAHGARRFAPEGFFIVIGCNADDAQAFPDCREPFIRSASLMLSSALTGVVGHVHVLAPWITRTKRQIASWAREIPAAWSDVRDSQSCYRGTRCGECDACLLRSGALGADDGSWIPALHGGDTGR